MFVCRSHNAQHALSPAKVPSNLQHTIVINTLSFILHQPNASHVFPPWVERCNILPPERLALLERILWQSRRGGPVPYPGDSHAHSHSTSFYRATIHSIHDVRGQQVGLTSPPLPAHHQRVLHDQTYPVKVVNITGPPLTTPYQVVLVPACCTSECSA